LAEVEVLDWLEQWSASLESSQAMMGKVGAVLLAVRLLLVVAVCTGVGWNCHC